MSKPQELLKSMKAGMTYPNQRQLDGLTDEQASYSIKRADDFFGNYHRLKRAIEELACAVKSAENAIVN